jgi:hypothetical protein
MLRADADTAADPPGNGTAGLATPVSPAWSCGGQDGPGPGRTPDADARVQSPGQDQNGPAAGPRRRQNYDTKTVRHRAGTPSRQQAYRSGRAGIQALLRSEGIRGSNQALNALARMLNAELAGMAELPARLPPGR